MVAIAYVKKLYEVNLRIIRWILVFAGIDDNFGGVGGGSDDLSFPSQEKLVHGHFLTMMFYMVETVGDALPSSKYLCFLRRARPGTIHGSRGTGSEFNR